MDINEIVECENCINYKRENKLVNKKVMCKEVICKINNRAFGSFDPQPFKYRECFKSKLKKEK